MKEEIRSSWQPHTSRVSLSPTAAVSRGEIMELKDLETLPSYGSGKSQLVIATLPYVPARKI